jgi:hypothetical protein
VRRIKKLWSILETRARRHLNKNKEIKTDKNKEKCRLYFWQLGPRISIICVVYVAANLILMCYLICVSVQQMTAENKELMKQALADVRTLPALCFQRKIQINVSCLVYSKKKLIISMVVSVIIFFFFAISVAVI